MQIKSTLKNRSGQILNIVYSEEDPFVDLEGKILQAVHGFCFYRDQMIIVFSEVKGYWTLPGGGIEPRETYEEALVREVKEETNTKVIYQEFMGFQDIYEPTRIIRQTRSLCIVEPLGDFTSDPDGDVTEIKFIHPKDYRQYFDWGNIGERLINRVLIMKDKYDSSILLQTHSHE